MSLTSTMALVARADDSSGRPASYKAIGVSLAVASGLFIGVSFVLKKTGLLRANVKYNEEAGEGYGYLKNFYWWAGMTLMIIGEICNFVAYAFVDAILVTPLGALSVVVTTILSAIFLKERLSFVGKVGCFTCILGSVVIALNAPEQSSVSDIQEMKQYVISPGFLSYTGVVVVGCAFTALWAGPRYGNKSMFVYITVCSLIGGLSVVATQGLGAAIIAQIKGESQFKEWFTYVLFVFVIATLLTEIIYLNKALNIFNAAMVTPTYYVLFTSATIITSAILFQGFKGSGKQIATVILGFLQICAGVVLLQLSKSSKDVPDAAVFKGDLNQIREVATQEDPEYEPKADAIRGASAIIRRLSTPRRNMETEEARRYFRERQEDQKPLGENEVVEWDGLRRRRTVLGEGPTMSRTGTLRTTSTRTPSIKSPLPPWGMSRFPEDDEESRPSTKQSANSFLDEIRARTRTASIVHHPWQPIREENEMPPDEYSEKQPVDTSYHGPSMIHWAEEGRHSGATSSPRTKRQFSFNVLNRFKNSEQHSPKQVPHSIVRPSLPNSKFSEEERLGLVPSDSQEEMDEKLVRTDSNESDDPLPSGKHESFGSTSPQYHSDFGPIDRPAPLKVNPLPPLPGETPYEEDVFTRGDRRGSDTSAGSMTSAGRGGGRGRLWRRQSEMSDDPGQGWRRGFK